MAWTELNRVSVNNGPQPGQDWRASDNFTISPPGGTAALRWTILTPSCIGARFGVAEDVSGEDPTLLNNLASGSSTAVISGNDLYIGGVSNAPTPFVVLIEGQT